MSKIEVKRCEVCGNQYLSRHEKCPNCGELLEFEADLSKNNATLIIPLARSSKSSKKEKQAFVPSRIVEEKGSQETSGTNIFLGTGFLINVVSSKNNIQYEVNNLGNEFLGFVECENTSSGIMMRVRDVKGLIIDTVEGNPQYTQYTIKDRYNKKIGIMQQQGVLKQNYIIVSLEDNVTLKIWGDPNKKEYSLVKNGQIFVNILKTSPETYKIEVKNRVDSRIPLLFSMVIDATQRRKK